VIRAGGTEALTEAHRRGFCDRLTAAGHAVGEALAAGRLLMVDARETLVQFMEEFVKKNNAQLWIQHDYTAGIKRKIAPEFYE